ncbi:MAG: DUF6064 family protein [Rhodospirillales bacterium]|nr:DUF6064 family protein [Rhodospirillales bacterium]MDE0382192.1 DUF6064 family protein [Rhodospirillales bacterium]
MAGLEDLLLFDARVYWRLFALENAAVWPAQPVAAAAALLLVLRLLRGRRLSGRWLGPLLGAAWLWSGWHFVALRYGTVNSAAPTFAWGFYAEAALLAALGLSGRLVLLRQGPGAWAGLGLAAVAAFVWPLLARADGRPWGEAEVVVLAPDPTALATLGLLACAGRNRWTALLCAAPVLWLALSALTLVTLGAWQGWIVLAALLAGIAAWAAPGRTPAAGP